MFSDRLEHQLPIDTVKIGLHVEIEHPVVAPTALPSRAHRIDCRLAGSVAVGIGMKHRLQDRLQITTGHLLGDSVSDRGHGHIELHFDPASLWDRLRSRTLFIPSVARSLWS